MRHLISGIVAAFAVMAAAPAMACGGYSCGTPCGYSYGYSPCVQPAYVAPVASFSYGYGHGGYGYGGYGYGCGTGCGWAAARLVEPTTQYYYVNQGPTSMPFWLFDMCFRTSALRSIVPRPIPSRRVSPVM